MLISVLKKIFPLRTRTWMKGLSNRMKLILGYIFMDSHNKAHARWVLSGGEEKRYHYQLNQDSVVFDVGGYHGDFTERMNRQYGCKAYVFEPVKEYAQAIEERFRGNTDIKVYCFGLSDHSSQDTILLDDDGSSVHGNASKDAPTEQIVLKDIVEFMDSEKIEKLDLLKLNIEGGEYEVFHRLIASGYLNKIRYIQVQFHEINTDSKNEMTRIVEQLPKTHRLMWKCRPFIWESWELK